MTKIITVANQKGGVGKTTTSVNLAAGLAVSEVHTLLIDMDPQANATLGCGIDYKSLVDTSIYEVLVGGLDINANIRHTEIPYLDILPSTTQLVGAEIEMVSMIGREMVLKKALDHLEKEYEYIIIDCPPSLGLLTINSLTASDSVMIPIQCEYYALEGLGQLLNTIRLVQRSLNRKLLIEGVLLTMYDSRLRLSQEVSEQVQSHFKDKVYKTFIRRNIRLGESPGFGKPIILYDASSAGAQDYMNLVGEILNNDGQETR
ncbi:MAG TPA: chromosome partitioning protein ParA [Candidatus Marinimicrobia bacterium]|nr:chromosome partitioning protein ParA [Candidatus Neomarinimicrobiota bacterium]